MGIALGLLLSAVQWTWRSNWGETSWPELWTPVIGLAAAALGLRLSHRSAVAADFWGWLCGWALGKALIPLLSLPGVALLAFAVGVLKWRQLPQAHPSREEALRLRVAFAMGWIVLPYCAIAQRLSYGTVYESAAVLAALGLGSWWGVRSRTLKTEHTWAVVTLWPLLGAILIPAFVRPTFYPFASAWLGIGAIVAALVAPSQWAGSALLKDAPLSWRVLLAIAAGVLVSGPLTHLWGPHPALGALGLAGLGFLLLENVRSKKPPFALIGLAGVLLVALVALGMQQAVAPPHEAVVQKTTDRLDTWALVRDRANQNLGIRLNYHTVVSEAQNFAVQRRRALLGLALNRDAKKVLLLGGTNPLGTSAILEHYVPLLITTTESAAVVPFSTWFISEEASKNRLTNARRITGDWRSTLAWMRAQTEYVDIAVVEESAPQSETDFYKTTPEFYADLKDRMYPTGVVIQWFDLNLWTLPNLAAAWKGFQSVFGADGAPVWLWRGDLSPDRTHLAFVAYKPKSASSRADKKQDKRLPIRDPLLGTPFGADALLLADGTLASQVLHTQAAAPNSWLWPSQLARAARDRLGWSVLGASPPPGKDFLLQLLAQKSEKDGPVWGGLLWTRAMLKRRAFAAGDVRPETKDWAEEKQAAIRGLLFDPTREYPEMKVELPIPGSSR